MDFVISDIQQCILGKAQLVNKQSFRTITNIAPVSVADKNSLSFIASDTQHKTEVLKQTKAGMVICDFVPEDQSICFGKCLIVTENPKLYFARLVNSILNKKSISFIHPTAIIHPEAYIGDNVQIGPYTCIGKSRIGDGCILHSHVSIYDGVMIGKNATIDSGTVIGAAGFGYVRDEKGIPVMFPQLGGVVIGDNVDIGANVCIDRGALQDTVIGNNTKIDNFSQISHNNVIGENNYIISSFVAGSVKIGNDCWIAPSKILNKVSVGDRVTVGYGATVMDNLENDKTYYGYPAMELKSYVKKEMRLKKIIDKRYER